MAYHLVDLTPPADWPTFWDQAQEALDFMDGDFRLPFETKAQAIAKPHNAINWSHLRFRRTDDRDNLQYFYELGCKMLEKVRKHIECRKWTPALAHNWALLMFCHGFIMPSAFAVADDLGPERGGAISRTKFSLEANDRWFSHYFLRVYRKRDRPSAEDAVERLLRAIQSGTITEVGGFPSSWFEPMLNEGSLVERYRDKRLSVARMRELASLPASDLPPLDLFFPSP